jgi:hypothetical protein
MNIRRGLIRTWVVLSVFCVVIMGNNNFPDVNMSDWQMLAWIFVAPPVVLAVVLTALGWIIAGFRGRSSV